jgi:hypothetical protein
MPVKVGLKYIEKWNTPLEKSVCAYEQEPIIKDQIVFYGPSYFTRWGTKYGMIPLRDAIKGGSGEACCVNRGFGSSCAEHHLYYYHRMILPLEPRVLVYHSSGNALTFGYTQEEVWELAQRVIMYTLTDFPDVRIYLCSTNPKRGMTEEEINERRIYNGWLKEFAENNERCFYVELLEDKRLHDPEIFVADGVHYNQKGYDLYTEIFTEVLKDELEKY